MNSTNSILKTKREKEGEPLRFVGKILSFILDFLMHLTENVGAVLLAVMTLVITWQVISRYNPHINSPWTEEVALILLVWFGMTGAAVGIRKGTHIGVEFVVSFFSEKTRRVLRFIVGLFICFFSVFLFFEGLALAKGCWTDQLSATLLPRGIVVYLAVPSAAFLMFIYSLEIMVKQVKKEGGENADV